MADLDPTLPLEGVTSTHPTLAETPGDAAQQTAQIQGIQAGTQLTNQQTTGLSLQNQLLQQQQQFAQTWAQATANVANKVKAGGTPSAIPAATNASVPDLSSGLNSTAGTVQPNGVPASITAPVSSNQSTNPPGTTNVLPAGVDPSWKIDSAHDWYTDADGTPISHYAGPASTPSGRVNLHSADLQDQVADQAVAAGASPMLVAQMRLQGEQKAEDLDKTNIGIYKDSQDAQKAAQDAKDANQRAMSQRQGYIANEANRDLQSPNPGASFIQSVTMMPNAWDSIIKSNVPQGQPPITSPSDPRIIPILKGLQASSTDYQAQQRATSEGVHILPGVYNPVTLTTSQGTAFKVDADGKVQTLLGGGTGSSGSSSGPGGPAAPTPLQAFTDAVGTYRTPLQQVPARARPAVEASLAQQYPDYDQTQFVAKNKALTDYTSGQDHRTVVAIQTAYNHLDQLKTATQALNSGNLPMFNSISQAYEKATGDAIPTNANAIKLVALDEVSKALTGASGGEGDRDKAQQIVNLAGSPSQVGDAIDKLRGLMQGKVGPLQDAATAAGLTSKQQQSIFGNLYQTPGSNGRVISNPTPTPAAQTVNNPTKVGDVISDSKGNHFVYRGGPVNDIKSYAQVQ